MPAKSTQTVLSKDLNTELPSSFEAGLAELEKIVSQMEQGQLPLESSLEVYRRGVFLIQFCQQRLQKVEAEIKVLEGDLLKPWQDNSDNQ